MDVLQAEIGKESPWVMLFADDLVICEHSRSCVAARKMERDIWVPRTKQRKNRVYAIPRKRTNDLGLHPGKRSEYTENGHCLMQTEEPRKI